MNTYPFRALTRKGELFTFTIYDIPTKINECEFILANKPGTPILKIEKITRGMDVPGIFEGDILDVDGQTYVIVYDKGFTAISMTGNMKYIHDISDLKIVSNIYKQEIPIDFRLKKKMTFKYRDMYLKMFAITGPYREFMLVNTIKEKVDPFEVQQEVGCTYNNRKLYFGDTVNGLPVHLYKGRPVVSTQEGEFDIISKKLIF